MYAYPKHRICELEFNNGTSIRVAVCDEKMDKTFDDFYEKAKEISWNGDETIGRGMLIRFSVGEWIHV